MAKENPFDPDLVRELANLIADTDLSEIEVEKGDLRIRVARTVTAAVSVPVAAPAALVVTRGREHVVELLTAAAAALLGAAVGSGSPLRALLGTAPATAARCEPGGDPAFVPPYDACLLLDTDFASGRPLLAVAPPSRAKGWRGWPLGTEDGGNGLVVEVVAGLPRTLR